MDRAGEARVRTGDASAPLPAEGGGEAGAPLALIRGTPVLTLPQDLYIPPDALEVFLETFEGPLDLLLYLIKRQNLDILDIPIADITAQYMEYVELMSELRLELAAEYLLMAAMLAEIKSRMLLPRPAAAEDEESDLDPRAELVRRLLEYERFKRAAQTIDALPRLERDLFPVAAELPPTEIRRLPPPVELDELIGALRAVLARADLYVSHRVERESLSLRERMSMVLERLGGGGFRRFTELFDLTEGRAGAVVTFLAVLELVKSATLELVQPEPFAPIHVRLRDSGADESQEHDDATAA
ncbi:MULTISPECIES: ScpA family protein [Marichromatium]|uniref:Segregation and condensation protein A n=1 Tax=Marichromatium gracile TaxID=1048 RepID=A0A4R4A7L8_MARGR|nr:MULTISPECIES: ScpA family protein [Marichromatium]MBK1709874.1 segregation/condensation protein A [Marichromatium gracile]RNE89270.1 segregation/condensation protein A [Marichromatium sp. AB31]TCW34853.1 condensin subunit ScpA [Marichromatium gracile]